MTDRMPRPLTTPQTAEKRARPRRQALPLYDYDQAATLTGYTPSYLKFLCDRRQLGYVVQTYYRGHKRRRVRRIPYAALEALVMSTYVPPIDGKVRRRGGR
jgi:hypothetical protein